MGSEQSSQSNASETNSKTVKLKRGKSVPESSWPRNPSQDGQHSRAASTNTSPGHSVCSDIDLPYVSYTVNRPIGGMISTIRMCFVVSTHTMFIVTFFFRFAQETQHYDQRPIDASRIATVRSQEAFENHSQAQHCGSQGGRTRKPRHGRRSISIEGEFPNNVIIVPFAH